MELLKRARTAEWEDIYFWWWKACVFKLSSLRKLCRLVLETDNNEPHGCISSPSNHCSAMLSVFAFEQYRSHLSLDITWDHRALERVSWEPAPHLQLFIYVFPLPFGLERRRRATLKLAPIGPWATSVPHLRTSSYIADDARCSADDALALDPRPLFAPGVLRGAADNFLATAAAYT